MHRFADFLIHLMSVAGVKADNGVESYCLFLLVDKKSVCLQNVLYFQGFVSFQMPILCVTKYSSPLFFMICGMAQLLPNTSGSQQVLGVMPNVFSA